MSAATSADGAGTNGEDAKPLPLLELPPEIWSNIVKMAIDNGPAYDSTRMLEQALSTTHYHQPAITRTCRAIRQETLPCSYATKFIVTWNIPCSGYGALLAGRLFNMAGQQNRKAIRGVRIYDDVTFASESHDGKSMTRYLRKVYMWNSAFQLERCWTLNTELRSEGIGCTYDVKFA